MLELLGVVRIRKHLNQKCSSRFQIHKPCCVPALADNISIILKNGSQPQDCLLFARLQQSPHRQRKQLPAEIEGQKAFFNGTELAPISGVLEKKRQRKEVAPLT
jgi:hypothetical protein